MKKLLLLFVSFLLLNCVVISQNVSLKNIPSKRKLIKEKNSITKNWYSFADAVVDNEKSSLISEVLFPDTNVVIDYGSEYGLFRPVVHSIATIIDPLGRAFSYLGNEQITFTSYKVDSIDIMLTYTRNLPGDVPDTLIVEYWKIDDPMASENIVNTLRLYQNGSYEIIPFLNVDWSEANYQTNPSLPGVNNYTKYTQKILLKPEDTSTAENNYLSFYGIKTSLSVAAGGVVGAAVSFKPGYVYSANDTLNNLNYVQFYSLEEKTSDFNPYPGDLKLGYYDFNCSYVLPTLARYNYVDTIPADYIYKIDQGYLLPLITGDYDYTYRLLNKSSISNPEYYSYGTYISSFDFDPQYSYEDHFFFFQLSSAIPKINIIKPLNTDTLIAGNSYQIEWLADNISNAKVEIFYNDVVISTLGTFKCDSLNTYQWNVPSTYESGVYWIKITSIENTAIYSLLPVYIKNPSFIEVISPNGGESYVAGKVIEVEWKSNSVSKVTIELLDNGMSVYSVYNISSGSTNSYLLQLPINLAESNKYKVRITNSVNSKVYDESDAFFYIGTPLLTITYPPQGQTIYANTQQLITWNYKCVDSVKIEISTKNYTNIWETIVESTPASKGCYTWVTPSISASDCKIRISDVSNSNLYSESGKFAIKKPIIQIVKPNGGERIVKGYPYKVDFLSEDVTYIKVQLQTQEGGPWFTLSSSSSASEGYYIWPNPSIVSSSCKLKISDANYPEAYDESDEVFTVYDPNDITSVEEMEVTKADISLYPNPVIDNMGIVSNGEKILNLSIYNYTGERVYSSCKVADAVNLSNISSGIYVAKFITEKGNTIIKTFVKK